MDKTTAAQATLGSISERLAAEQADRDERQRGMSPAVKALDNCREDAVFWCRQAESEVARLELDLTAAKTRVKALSVKAADIDRAIVKLSG